jgi:predicted small metal-binding protein
MRAMDCECGHHLEAEDDEGLVAAGRAHVAEVHPDMNLSDDDLRQLVSAQAYDA